MGAPPYGSFKHRIIIPFYRGRELMTFVGRIPRDDVDPKYKNCAIAKSVLDPKRMVYNAHRAGKSILLVEGCFDVWRVKDNVGGLNGIKVTTEQIMYLYDLGFKNVFVMFDGGAVKQAYKVAHKLALFFPHTEVVELDEGVDPDNLGRSDLKSIQKMLTTVYY